METSTEREKEGTLQGPPHPMVRVGSPGLASPAPIQPPTVCRMPSLGNRTSSVFWPVSL